MYNIGDKIVYPMHGAGVIESVEEKEILGKKQQYYIMKMPIGDMKVLIPVNNVNEIGIRSIVDGSCISKAYEILKEDEIELDSNWNKRYRDNMLKIKSGDICEVARVVKSLVKREKSKGLSTGERKMLTNAKQILISEIVLVENSSEDSIEKIIESIV